MVCSDVKSLPYAPISRIGAERTGAVAVVTVSPAPLGSSRKHPSVTRLHAWSSNPMHARLPAGRSKLPSSRCAGFRGIRSSEQPR